MGVLNCFPPANWDWNATGPMARYVEDLGLVLSVVANRFKPNDRPLRASKLRVAYLVSDGNSQPDEPIAEHFEDLGARITEDRPDCFSSAS